MTDAALPSPFRVIARRLGRAKLALASVIFLAALAVLVLAAPAIEAALGIDPDAVDLLGRNAPPSSLHLLGTDELGRDFALRLLHGGRVSLAVGIAAALASALLGTAIGLLAGYAGGWWDGVLMRATDAVIALPLLPLLIVLAALDPAKIGLAALVDGPAASTLRIVVLVALFGWTTTARLVRGVTLSLREREHVRAARALGAGPSRIMLVHILPGAFAPIIVATTLAVGNVILLESVLSFLGLGIEPPQPSWGSMLTNAQDLVWSAPWLAVWPGLMIFLTVIACNLLGDGLRDALDPRAPSGH